MKKIISYNLLILSILIISIEIVFGYWFDPNNFGIYMRKHRLRNDIFNVKINQEVFKVTYRRNFHGFRGDEISDINKIKYIFLGGSTGNEKFLPENLTIVQQINSNFKNINSDIYIFNASVDGKTTKGYTNDFKFWFPKLRNFNPKYFLVYTGINDTVLNQAGKYDMDYDYNIFFRVRDYIVNCSITVEMLKKLKWKYFNNVSLSYNFDDTDNLYQNFQYIDYNKAKKIHNLQKLEKKHQNLKERYEKRLSNLLFEIKKKDAEIIFITQVKYNGLENEKLYLLNEILKKFSEKNKIKIIKLDEIYIPNKNDFYDPVHTSPKGSKKIADIIFSNLIK